MANRELAVLGTASQAPTRTRNHNGYLLRWEKEGILFDPGEGTQRQMLLAGVTASEMTRMCVTHFHGDHCLGLPGVLYRMALDQVRDTVQSPIQPATGPVRPAAGRGAVPQGRRWPKGRRARRCGGPNGAASPWRHRALSHSVPTFGYRLTEPDGRRMLPAWLANPGMRGPEVGGFNARAGSRSAAASSPWRRSATRGRARVSRSSWTPACVRPRSTLPTGADMLVFESTFLATEAALAPEHGHLTAGQARRIAAEAGAWQLVLTHFSQRYESGPDGDKRLAGRGGRGVRRRGRAGPRPGPAVPVPPRRGPGTHKS